MLAVQDIWSGISIAQQLSWFAPEIALICTMLAIVAAPILLGRSPKTIGTVASIGILVTFLLALRGCSLVTHNGHSGLSPIASSGMLIADNLAVFFKLLVVIFLGGVTWMWWMGSSKTERNAPEFFILLLGSALGMGLMVSTTNLLMIAIAIETASLPSYAIVGFDKRNAKSAEASLKYMVFGAICAAIMIYGISLIY